MTNLGIPVPPGFTITTEAWRAYVNGGKRAPTALWPQVRAALGRLEAAADLKLGDPERPLLVSVRSGARASMPGMMDTVLNLGLNDQSVHALGHDAGDARFAWDSYRRFIQMYGDVVMGVDHDIFEEILEDEKARLGHEQDTELSAVEWQHVITRYKDAIEETLGEP
ncbi:MAG TPA: PEP/pyruvate-binding domain-containing protein, partial [Methylomirabilota bacterium]